MQEAAEAPAEDGRVGQVVEQRGAREEADLVAEKVLEEVWTIFAICEELGVEQRGLGAILAIKNLRIQTVLAVAVVVEVVDTGVEQDPFGLRVEAVLVSLIRNM